jgi:ATP-dependent protease ClpP protease subunit
MAAPEAQRYGLIDAVVDARQTGISELSSRVAAQ